MCAASIEGSTRDNLRELIVGQVVMLSAPLTIRSKFEERGLPVLDTQLERVVKTHDPVTNQTLAVNLEMHEALDRGEGRRRDRGRQCFANGGIHSRNYPDQALVVEGLTCPLSSYQ